MTSAVQGYIYLTQNGFMNMCDNNTEENLLNKLKTTKSEILDGAINRHNERVKATSSKFKSEPDDSVEEKISEILTGKNEWIEDLNSYIIPNGKAQTAGQAQYGDLVKAALQLKESSKNHGTQINEYKKALNKFIDSLDNYLGEGVKEDYCTAVLNKFLDSARYGSKSAKEVAKQMYPEGTSKQTGVARMLGSLADKYGGEAFSVVSNISDETAQAKLSAALGKLIALKEGLNSKEGKDYLRNLDRSKKNKFYKDVQANTGKWINDITALVEEIAHIKGIGASAKYMQNKYDLIIDEIKSTHRMKGGKNIAAEIKFEEDSRIKDELKRIDDIYKGVGGRTQSMINQGTPKADVLYNIGDSCVSATVGISVKKSESLNFNNSTKQVSIKLQESTPLLTLFYREANLTYDDLTTFINVGAALPLHLSLQWDDYTYDQQLADDWNTIIESVKYRSFYACLAGLGGTDVENVFFMSVNGRIFSIATLLQYVRKNIEKDGVISWNSSQAKRARIAGNGLDRNSYQALNKDSFIGKEGKPNAKNKQQRSLNVRNKAIKLMQETKLEMSMNIGDLSKLVGH